ncbi:hypothetical protein GCM10009087_04960 [Sphingomonas oligophenolica]
MLGTSDSDPVGATFSEIYNGDYNYIVWNDQFQTYPIRNGGNGTGHSKGILAWNKDGDGLVMQVSTPGWPGSGSAQHARKVEGNTLGCLTRISDNLKVAQHFFMLKLSSVDVALVLRALANSKVVTKATDLTIWNVSSVQPDAIADAIALFSHPDTLVTKTDVVLSSHIRLISKSPSLNVPTWQFVSAELAPAPATAGPALRTATWTSATMGNTTGSVACWDESLKGIPGPIIIATDGSWGGKPLKLGISSSHAKIGITTEAAAAPYVIFSDLNEDGGLSPPACKRAQNGRGGMFFVIEDKSLHDSLTVLIPKQATEPN